MMGMVDKSDRLDARGLGILQRTGTLPKVWIPSGEIRDRRGFPEDVSRFGGLYPPKRLKRRGV